MRGPDPRGQAEKETFPVRTMQTATTAGIMVERDVISRMESGARIVTDFEAVTIAEVLEVPVLWLLDKE